MNRSAYRLLLIVILLAGWGVRLRELARQNIWWDEARNIDVALRPFLQVATAPELDIHPPVYFWLLHVWGIVARVSMALEPEQIAYLMRFVSVLAGAAGVALLFALALSVDGRRAALLAAAIGAFSPFWLAESQESRMYTLGFALLMAAALLFLRRIRSVRREQGSGDDSQRSALLLAGFAMLSALALTTHYNAVFILVAWYAWWGVYAILGERGNRWREVLVAAVTGTATLVLVAPVTPIALRQIPGYENPNLTVPSVAEYLWQNWQAYIGGYAFSAEWAGGLGTIWLVAVLAVFAAGVGLHAAGARTTYVAAVRSRFSFVFFWLAGGLALYYVAVLDRGAFNVRYSSFVTPALYVSLAVGIVAWRRLYVYLPVLFATILMAGFALGIQADWYDEQHAREDIAGVVKWLRDHTGPNDVVLVDQKYPFGFYYDRYAIEADGEPEGSEAAPARYLFVDINEIDARLNDWAAEAENVFWVQWFESDTDPRRAVSFLLDKEGDRGGEEWFRGYSIDWWRLDPPTEFALAPEMQQVRHQFGQAVQTVEASLPNEPLAPGQKAPIVIRWERVPGGSIDRPLKARVAIYDEDGARIAQTDHAHPE